MLLTGCLAEDRHMLLSGCLAEALPVLVLLEVAVFAWVKRTQLAQESAAEGRAAGAPGRST
jgi:hypothetical protein